MSRVSWRRDCLAGMLGMLLSLCVSVPCCWAAICHERDLAKRNLIDEAMRAALDLGLAGDTATAEVFHVETGAVAPEVPQGAHLLIDKQSPARAVGDIVVFRVEDKTFLGRIVAPDVNGTGYVIGRNEEPNRVVRSGDVVGRGVLNTR